MVNRIFFILLFLCFACEKKDYRKNDISKNQGGFAIAFDYFVATNNNTIYVDEVEICTTNKSCNIINLVTKRKDLGDSGLVKTGKVIGNIFIFTGLLIASTATNGTFLYGSDALMMKFKDDNYRENLSIFFLPEGVYYINSLKFNDNSKIIVRNYIKPFEIKFNEVVYFGNISGKICNNSWFKKSIFLSVEDRFFLVESYMNQKASFAILDDVKIHKRLISIDSNLFLDECKYKL